MSKNEKSYESIDDNNDGENIVIDYDLTASPNDFNIKTLYDFIKSGIVKIPGFQRNYIWDIKRASKLIESIILGIPIPQIFLYQEAKNSFLVIDGQQRYMTIYYFIRKRFPKKEIIYKLSEYFQGDYKGVPDEILFDNKYFIDFNLKLPERLPDEPNFLNKKNYDTLEEDYKTTFDLRTIRNVIIKENKEEKNMSSIYEIFNRLNSGGVNLTSQEIRCSLFHSKFYEMIYDINKDVDWRRLSPTPNPDIHMKDIEMILRVLAILMRGSEYKPSMTKFLNIFSNDAKKFSDELINHLKNIFLSFVKKYKEIGNTVFYTPKNRFSVTIFESIFYFSCIDAYNNKNLNIKYADGKKINKLRADEDYVKAITDSTASSKSVKIRLEKALEYLK